MKFTTSQQELNKALAFVSKAVTVRSTMPVLKGILLSIDETGTLTMTASDMDLSIEKKMEVSDFEPGAVVLPAKLFTAVSYTHLARFFLYCCGRFRRFVCLLLFSRRFHICRRGFGPALYAGFCLLLSSGSDSFFLVFRSSLGCALDEFFEFTRFFLHSDLRQLASE